MFFQVTRSDDEILKGCALQVIHDHVNRIVFPKEVQHAHHRCMRNLGERPAFFKKTLQAQPIQRQLVRLHLRQQLAYATTGERRWQVFLHRNLLPLRIQSKVHNAKSTRSQLTDNSIPSNERIRRKRCGFDL